MSIIEVLRMKAEGQIEAKQREFDLRAREIAIQERKLALEERKYLDRSVPAPAPAPVQYDRLETWQL